MQKGALHVASGRHATVIAVPRAGDVPGPGWSAIKVVYGPKSGRTEGSKPHDAVREVQILRSLDHLNIVRLLDYQYHPELFEHHLHLPLLPISLASLLEHPLHDKLIRSIIYQALSALAYIHSKGIAHRDINPHNIMIDWDGKLKLIDFGIAWAGGDDNSAGDDEVWRETKDEMICSVGTGYWRAPELLFSPTSYDAFALDLWGLGIVISDLHHPHLDDQSDSDDSDSNSEESRDPLEADDSDRSLKARARLFNDTFGDVGLAASIFRVLGTPTPQTWHDFTSLPDAGKIEFVPTQPQSLAAIYTTMSPELLDLLGGLLQLSPSRRTAAKEALEHAYFDRVLVPSGGLYEDRRCVEEIEGKRLIDHLQEELDEARDKWGF